MSKPRLNIVAITLVLCTLAAAGVVAYQTQRQPPPVAVRTPTPTPVPSPTPALNPLAIPAIQSRGYTGSAITTTQSLGEQGGYTSSVVSFASDGFTEYALLATPDSPRPAAGYPAIILVHGYIPPTQYRTVSSDYRDWIAAWARAGYVVIVPDLRGNGASQGVADSGHFSPVYTYDVLNLIESLKIYSLTDPQRIGIAGHSMGGHVALRAAVVSPDIKATVLVNGVTGSMYDIWYNWPHSPATHDQPTASIQAEHQALVDQHGTPKSNPDFWAQASAVNYVSQIKGPVMVNHDTGDSVVPLAFSQSLVNALTAARRTVTFYQYPGDDHQMSSPGNHALLLERTTAFWKANL